MRKMNKEKDSRGGLKMIENVLHFGLTYQILTDLEMPQKREKLVTDIFSQEKSASIEGTNILITQAIAGDINAMECLYESFFRDIFRTVYRQYSIRETAEEIVNDTFLTAFKRLETLKNHDAFRSWLLSIAINHVRNRRRNEMKKRTVEMEDIHSSRDAHNPILKAALRQAIQNLPAGYREVFMLHDADGFTHEEISKILKISEGTSKSQLFKARNMLRQTFLGKQVGKNGGQK
jgi:RNA polymerase sigma-70 factor (ECF subfamily)